MTDLSETSMAQLAREMVMNIRNYKAVFADFEISEADYYEILKNPYYQKIKDHLTVEWNSTTSTVDRVRMQGAAGIELVLPALTKRIKSETEPLASAIEGAKFMAKLAGISEAKAETKNAAERFVITINLGADVEGKPMIEHYDKSIAPDANDVALPAPSFFDVDDK